MKDGIDLERALISDNLDVYEAFHNEVLSTLEHRDRIVPMILTSDDAANIIYALIDDPTPEELAYLKRELPRTYEHNGSFEVRVESVETMIDLINSYAD